MWLKQVLFSLFALGFLWSIAPSAQAGARPDPRVAVARVIRLRVIANSDNPTDQALKLDVRDAVLRQLEPALIPVRSEAQAVRQIRRRQEALARVANAVLMAHHVAYRARVIFTTTLFPTKAYGSWVLPAGRYRALLIVLGRGQGHNWWCVLFPSLCFVDRSQSLAVPTAGSPTPEPLPAGPVPALPPSSSAALMKSPGVKTAAPDDRLENRRPVTGRIRVSWRLPSVIGRFLAFFTARV